MPGGNAFFSSKKSGLDPHAYRSVESAGATTPPTPLLHGAISPDRRVYQFGTSSFRSELFESLGKTSWRFRRKLLMYPRLDGLRRYLEDLFGASSEVALSFPASAQEQVERSKCSPGMKLFALPPAGSGAWIRYEFSLG